MDEVVEDFCWFLLVQMVSLHITYLLLNIFVDRSSFGDVSQIPLKMSLCTWRARFHQLTVNMLLAEEYSSIDVTIKKSSILHMQAKIALCAA